MTAPLELWAGAKARPVLRERGLRLEDLDVLVGASGGPKWLVLHGLDRALATTLFRPGRTRPLHLVGASIGAWRHVALAQRDPLAAIDRFREAYVAQRYGPRPSPEHVSQVSADILAALLGATGADELLQHPFARTHVLTNLARGWAASERRWPQVAALGLTAAGNLLHRRAMTWWLSRVAFHVGGEAGPLAGLDDLPTQHATLHADNLRSVILASGSIPLVLAGARIPGGPEGVHRDGGVIDYHPALPLSGGDGLVLYPHFFSRVTPGWFDKALPWRQARGAVMDRVVLLAPSPGFVARLPGGKVPDRRDFERLDGDARERAWRTVCAESERLGDAWRAWVERGLEGVTIRELT